MGLVEDSNMCQERIEAQMSGSDGGGSNGLPALLNGVLQGSGLELDDQAVQKLLKQVVAEGGGTSVVEIDLRGNLLESVPRQLESFTALKTLRLDGNRIHAISPRRIPQGVESLSLNQNCLEKLNAESECPPSLMELQVAGNKISELNFGSTLQSLRVLEAEENRLTSFDDSQLPALEELNLSGNSIENVTLVSAPLRLLRLGRNGIEVLKEGAFHPRVARSLQTLDLSGNALIKIEENIVKDFISLQSLNLSDNAKLKELPTTMVTLEKLENVDVSGCEILAPDGTNASSSIGFKEIRTRMREELLQKALKLLKTRLRAAESKCSRLDKLRLLREQEMESQSRVSRSQLEGSETSRTALESTSKALKTAVENERSRTRSLLEERNELIKELEVFRGKASDADAHRKSLAASQRRTGELELELKEVRRKLDEQDTILEKKEKLLLEMSQRTIKSVSPSTSSEHGSLRAETVSLRRELESKEKFLEAERLSVEALERELSHGRQAAAKEIERLNERVVTLEAADAKNGTSEAAQDLAHQLAVLSAELAADRAEKEILAEDVRKRRHLDSAAVTSQTQTELTTQAEMERLRSSLQSTQELLQATQQQNSRWRNLADLIWVADGLDFKGDPVDAMKAHILSLRQAGGNHTAHTAGKSRTKKHSSSVAEKNADPTLGEDKIERMRLLMQKSTKKLASYELRCSELETELAKEQELHRKSIQSASVATGELSELRSELVLRDKTIRKLRSTPTARPREVPSGEIIKLRKDLSIARAFGGNSVEIQQRGDAKVKVLEETLRERSVDLERLQVVLTSKESAITLLETKERELQEQAKDRMQQLRDAEAITDDLQNRLDRMASSQSAAETRAMQAEKARDERARDLAMSKRAGEQLTSERDGLRQKRTILEANVERQREEMVRLQANLAQTMSALESESAELVRSRKSLAASERRSAEQESELGRRGAQVHRLEAVVEEQKGKLRWKDKVLEELHERLAEQKLLAASRLEDVNRITSRLNDLQSELYVTSESMERVREMAAEAEERLTETLEAKERRDAVAEKASSRAEHAMHKLNHTEEQLRAAREVAIVREKALEEHSDVARTRVMELTLEGESVRKELRACNNSLAAKTTESEMRGGTITELESRVIETRKGEESWRNRANQALEALAESKADVERKQALLEWKDGEIANLLKRLNDKEEKSHQLVDQLQTTSDKLRQKDAQLRTEMANLRQLETVRDRLEAELAGTAGNLEKARSDLTKAEATVAGLDQDLKAASEREDKERYGRKELEVDLKGQKERVELLASKLAAAEMTLVRKNELVRLLEASTTEKEGEHTTTLTRLRDLEREYSERVARMERLEADLRTTKDELLATQRQVVERQEECRRLRLQTEQLEVIERKLDMSEGTISKQQLDLKDRSAKLADLQEKIASQAGEIAAHEKKQEELAEHVLEQETMCLDLKIKLKDAEQAVRAKRTEVEHVVKEHGIEVESRNQEIKELTKRQSWLESELSLTREDVVSREGQLAALRERMNRTQTALEEAHKAKSEQRSLLEDAEGAVAKYKVELNMTQRLLKTAEDELKSANSRITAEQTRISTNKSSLEVLQDKVTAKEESFAQLQRYSRFVNSKLHETEKSLAEKEQQFDSVSSVLKKLQSNYDALSKTVEDKETQLKSVESARIDEVSSLKSRVRVLEDTVEKEREQSRRELGPATYALREELEEARVSIREKDLRLNDLQARLDRISLDHEQAKQEVLGLKEHLIRRDNELMRVKSQLVDTEDAKQSIDSGTRLKLSEVQNQAESVAVRLQRAESDLQRMTESEQKWKTLCERMKPIVQRGQEAESTIVSLEKKLEAVEVQGDASAQSARLEAEREISLLKESLERQTQIIHDSREEASQYLEAYKTIRMRLAEAIKAGYSNATTPDDNREFAEVVHPVETEESHPDLVRVLFVLEAPANMPEASSTSLSAMRASKMRIVGGDGAIGNWSAEVGCELELVSPKRWQCEVLLPRGSSLEYKYVSCTETGFAWELGPNRVLDVSGPSDRVEIRDRYSALEWP